MAPGISTHFHAAGPSLLADGLDGRTALKTEKSTERPNRRHVCRPTLTGSIVFLDPSHQRAFLLSVRAVSTRLVAPCSGAGFLRQESHSGWDEWHDGQSRRSREWPSRWHARSIRMRQGSAGRVVRRDTSRPRRRGSSHIPNCAGELASGRCRYKRAVGLQFQRSLPIRARSSPGPVNEA